MSTILVLYASSEGQTARVADHVATVARERGHDVSQFEIDDVPPELDPAASDGVLVGASIHAGKHQKRARRFVENHRDALAAVPSGFFQVSLSSASDEPEAQAEVAGYVEDLRTATGWDPDRVGTFAGALRFSEYGWLKGKLMKAIARNFDADVTGEDREYTDWDAVTAFTEDFLALVAESTPETVRDTEAPV